MKRLTYQQAFNLITEAYIKDEIRPYKQEFCFCGTLNNNDGQYWSSAKKKHDGHYYYGFEFQRMEEALLRGIKKIVLPEDNSNDILFIGSGSKRDDIQESEKYEDALFQGMSDALDVLKQIHRERGEDVEEVQTKFTKRQLQKGLNALT